MQSKAVLLIPAIALMFGATALAQTKRQLPTPAQGIRNQFMSVNKRLLEMAKDFPEDKYNWAPSKDVRSFGDVVVHVMAGNEYAAKAGRGENAEWGEGDPKAYKSKAEIVAAFEKSVNDANATLKQVPDDHFKETLAPWLAVIEHNAEHYGQLVAYYRMNGLVPPASRKK